MSLVPFLLHKSAKGVSSLGALLIFRLANAACYRIAVQNLTRLRIQSNTAAPFYTVYSRDIPVQIPYSLSIGALIQRDVNQFAALSFKTLLGQAKILHQCGLAQLLCTILSNILRARIDDARNLTIIAYFVLLERAPGKQRKGSGRRRRLSLDRGTHLQRILMIRCVQGSLHHRFRILRQIGFQ